MHRFLKKAWLLTTIIAFTGFCVMILFASTIKAEGKEDVGTENVETEKKAATLPESIITIAKTLGAALAIGLAALATGRAQASIGSAGIGAVAENEKTFGAALIFLALPETILIFGFTIAAIILFII